MFHFNEPLQLQVYVKVSAFFRVSREKYPYTDTWPLLEKLIAVFGPKRLLWGRYAYYMQVLST